MVDVHQRGRPVETEDERQPGLTMDRVLSIHTMGAAQLTVLATALQPGHLTAPKLLLMAIKMALLRDPRLPHMAKVMAGALRHLHTKAAATVRTTSGVVIPRQAGGEVAAGKITIHTMLLPLVHTFQLLHLQQ